MAEPVGRETELEQLEGAVAAVAGGSARAVALVGEAGIAKSTLLAARAGGCSRRTPTRSTPPG